MGRGGCSYKFAASVSDAVLSGLIDRSALSCQSIHTRGYGEGGSRTHVPARVGRSIPIFPVLEAWAGVHPLKRVFGAIPRPSARSGPRQEANLFPERQELPGAAASKWTVRDSNPRTPGAHQAFPRFPASGGPCTVNVPLGSAFWGEARNPMRHSYDHRPRTVPQS